MILSERAVRRGGLEARAPRGLDPATSACMRQPGAERRAVFWEAAPFLVIALCALVLLRDDLFAGTIFFERDTELFYLPLLRWYLEQMQSGHLPLWTPLIFGGYPLFADGELGMLYPPNVLLAVLTGPDTFLQISRALHLLLAGSFTIGFLRVLGTGRLGATIGGLVFAFGSFFVAQLQHENVIRSAVWLPLILLFVELGLRAAGWRRQQWLVAGGLALAMAALGVHIQPVLMSLLCLGLFVLYRVIVGPVGGRWWERIVLLGWAPAIVVGVGIGMAAAQWLPLFELGRMSYRGPGLGYDLAATWPLRWQNLATVVLPYLFRLPDGRWVTLWQQWETYLYVGILPLGLAVVGALLPKRRVTPFFLLLTVLALMIGLAEQSPIVNIHRLLWELPGFSSLRAPGRYAYLIVFGVAGLAAFGCDRLARLERRSWPAVLAVGLVAGDLLAFGYDYHPSAPVSSLLEPAPVTRFLSTLGPDARVFADSSLKLLEPNRLLYGDVPTVAGYSSLGTQRHFEYWTSVDNQEDAVLDWWGVRQVVLADPPRDVVIVAGTAYRPYNALFRGAAANLTGVATFNVQPEPVRTVELRVLSTLIDGVQAEQDTPVAEITLVGTDGSRRAFQLLVGVHTAENAYDRPDVQPHLRHIRPAVAGQIPDVDPSGLPAQTNVYLGTFPVDGLDVAQVEVRQVYPVGHTRVFGLGLVDATGKVRSIFSQDRVKFHQIWQQDGIAVLQNERAFPRAYVVPEGIARTRTDDSALVRMTSRPFDAVRQVTLEDGPFEGLPPAVLTRPRFGQPLDPATQPTPAKVTDISSDHVRVETPVGPGGFLVLTDLYHRGWRARVDGQPAPVYLANFLFRAVYLPPGPHVVDFVFEPLSLRLGLAISVATFLFATTVAVVLPLLAERRRRPRPARR